MKLAFLRPLYDCFGGYVSAYLDIFRAREDAAEAIGLRWRAVRQQLADSGTDPDTLDAVGDAVTGPANAAPGIAVFARQGAVRFRSPLRDAPRREIARLSALPHVLPMLAQRPLQVPHLRVSADRAGGEVLAITATGGLRSQWSARQGWPVHKTPAGGWSQDHNQRNAENTWDDNARELASQTEAAAARVHAEHIVIGGDVRARSLLLDRLSTPLRQASVIVDSEVAADSKALAEAAEKIIAERAERTCRERFGQWQGALPHGRGVQGLAGVTAALRDGRAAEVFIADDPSSTAEAWAGPDGTHLALTPEELTERGVGRPVRERADAAVVRAIACADAELFFLPGDLPVPEGGIAATLRYLGDLAMSGNTTAIWAIVIVVVVALAVWLGAVRYAATHPGQKLRRKERMRGVVQGGQHVGGGRSVMPHRDAPVPEGGGEPPGPGMPDVEDLDAEPGIRGSRRGSGNPMGL